MVERFAAEAAILTKIQHPAVVRMYASGVTPDGRPFIAMEWLEGEDLSDRLMSGRTLTVGESVAMVRRIADGLGVTHALGIVHRDLKPSNLFLVNDDPLRVKVLDFGVARQSFEAHQMTATGTALGTPQYMSPEQASGQRVDVRSDVFSLGSVLFECLAGRPAYPGDNIMAVLTAILLGEVPNLADARADLPAGLSAVLTQMMAKKRDERLADGHAVSRALSSFGSLRAHAPASRSYKILTLTGAERRFVCLIAIGLDYDLAMEDINVDIAGETMADMDVEAELLRLRAVAGIFGARIDELPNGTLVAVLDTLGVPQQQLERAARCALRLREQLSQAPMVLTSGWGNLAESKTFDAIVARATAQFGAADPAGVLVDADSLALLGEGFVVRQTDDGTLLMDEQRQQASARLLLGKPTPCVGRARELALLETTLHLCEDNGEVAAILLTGDPGVGKSRLLVELLDRVRQQSPGVKVFTASADQLTAGATYGLLRAALRDHAGIVVGQDADVQRALLATMVNNAGPQDPQFVVEFLSEIVGVSHAEPSPQLRAARGDPALMAIHTREAFVRFMTAIASSETVMIVLDDLQWGDDVSLGLVDSLLAEHGDSDEEVAVMVLGIGRPETLDRFSGLWRDRGVSQLDLGRLGTRPARKLVRSVLGESFDDTTVKDLVERAEGNPYILEELIRATHRAGGSTSELPSSVLGMVQARLDALDGQARVVLRAGAVFGTTFWGSAVADLTGGAERADVAQAALEQALAAEFVRVEPTSRFEGETAYSFCTGTVREAAYAMLTDSDRSTGHHLAATWLTERGERDARLIAEHLERGGDLEAAAHQWLVAAAEALDANDITNALTDAGRGVATGVTGEVLGRLLVIEAEAAEWKGDAARAEASARRAVDVLPAGEKSWYAALANLTLASCRAGWTDEASARVAEMLDSTPVDDDARSRKVVALCRGALNAMWTGRYDLALQQGLAAEQAELVLDGAWPLARARLKHAEAYWYLHRGETGTAVGLFTEAEQAWAQAGDERSLTGVRTNLGFVYGQLGRFSDAEAKLREQMSRAELLGLTPLYHVCRHNLASVLAQRGDADAAIAMKEPAVARLSRAGNPRLDGNVIASLGHVLYQVGRPEEALVKADGAAAMLRPFAPTHAYALAVAAASQLALGDAPAALERASEGMRILAHLGGIEEGEALLRLVYAEAAIGAGQPERGIDAMRAAANRLVERAATILNPEHRALFLTAVPENATTLARAEKLGVAPDITSVLALGATSPPQST